MNSQSNVRGSRGRSKAVDGRPGPKLVSKKPKPSPARMERDPSHQGLLRRRGRGGDVSDSTSGTTAGRGADAPASGPCALVPGAPKKSARASGWMIYPRRASQRRHPRRVRTAGAHAARGPGNRSRGRAEPARTVRPLPSGACQGHTALTGTLKNSRVPPGPGPGAAAGKRDGRPPCAPARGGVRLPRGMQAARSDLHSGPAVGFSGISRFLL